MPAGSFDLSPIPAGLSVPAAPVIVCLYDPGGENPYTILPNVFCLRIDYREGAEPPLARFQYMMGDLLEAALGWPSQFEQLWPIDAQGNYIVQTDDRMVVLTQDPQGNAVVLFDGFAQIPQADLSAQTQSVTFVSQGVAIRLWDLPIFGRIQRDASNSTDTERRVGRADSATMPVQSVGQLRRHQRRLHRELRRRFHRARGDQLPDFSGSALLGTRRSV